MPLQEGPPDEEAEAAADREPQDDPVALLPRLDPPHELLQRPARTHAENTLSDTLGKNAADCLERIAVRQGVVGLTGFAR